MRKLTTNDEAFRLSLKEVAEIINIICSLKTPSRKTYRHWDEYAISFYLKMCTCFRVDYRHLEAATPDEQQGCTQSYYYLDHLMKTGVSYMLKTLPWAYEQEKHMEYKGQKQYIQPATKEMSHDDFVSQVYGDLRTGNRRLIVEGVFDFGLYSSGTGPDRIPYHLYLLLKEAGEIMSNTNDSNDLKMIEAKIYFFMTYFYSHLPHNFQYKRGIAVGCFNGLNDSMCEYRLDGYTFYRYVCLLMSSAFDPRTRLTPLEMVDIMNVIYSRKTPTFWGMSCEEISFYCKLCSCFGIEYHRLEAASENDVCLMNMRQKEQLASNE
ncbi:uncharacterized protein LOC143621074 [Bidens hawaiensis]|uniref:uncharacterized protein LOC143621074 n=1 Tax=Bidens hawaiensis TaxID=980011 RepID=UPI0040496044